MTVQASIKCLAIFVAFFLVLFQGSAQANLCALSANHSGHLSRESALAILALATPGEYIVVRSLSSKDFTSSQFESYYLGVSNDYLFMGSRTRIPLDSILSIERKIIP